MQSIVETQAEASVGTYNEGLPVTEGKSAIGEVANTVANDNEAAVEKEQIPSLYSALGYFPRCPYQWWLD